MGLPEHAEGRAAHQSRAEAPIAPIVNFAVFIAALAILAARMAAAHRPAPARDGNAEDPERARRQRRVERRTAILGWTLGLTFGTVGLLLGLILGGG